MRSWRLACSGPSVSAWRGALTMTSARESGEPTASSSAAPAVRVVHPPYRRHVGQLLRYLTPSTPATAEPLFATLSDRSRARQLSPEMAALVAEVAAQDTARAEAVSASAAVASTPDDLVRFVNILVEYLNAETDLEERLSSRHAVKRLRARAWEAQFGHQIRPTPLQRQEFLRVACAIVQQRRVSLVVASRLLRCRWPRAFSLDTGAAQQRFLRESIWAWLSDVLATTETTTTTTTTAREDTTSSSARAGPGSVAPVHEALTARDARAILDNCSFAFRDTAPTQSASADQTSRSPLTGPQRLAAALAVVASGDVETVAQPEPLISLLWSVHAARVPAPAAFWRPVVERLLVLNHHLGAEDGAARSLSAAPSARTSGRVCGHFFSGLTSRHLYRLLSLLKKERWPVEVGTLHELADLALKNIVFETETLYGESAQLPVDAPSSPPLTALTRRDVRKRIRAVSDLSTEEFLDLLLISGELGIPFSVSASKVADALLTPLVPYLDVQQLLTLLQVVRQTHCHSVPLILAAAASVAQRGPDVPYALPLAKALLRTVLRETAPQAQMDLSDFYLYFVRTVASVSTKVRPQELATLTAMLYDMYRRISPESNVARSARAAVDHVCRQMTRLVALQLVTDDDAAKVLEYTIVLGMRQDVTAYPHVQMLLEVRKRAVERRTHETRNDMLTALVEDSSTVPAELISFWGTQAESDLPQLPKAAVRVYEELIYLFERSVTIRATPTAVDMDRFTHVLDRTGLYGLLVGLDCLGHAHLDGTQDLPEDSSLHLARQRPIPNQLPGLLETRVLRAVNRRIQLAKLTADASDDAVLHVLGHVHCDAEKVALLVRVVAQSPSRLVRQQRAVWVYLEELAKRFGTPQQLASIQAQKDRALY